MDKLFIKCIDNSQNVDNLLVWKLVDCVKKNIYSELSIGELYELLFWDVMLTEYIVKIPYVQLVFIKYGDNVATLMIEYIKQSTKEYNLKGEDKVIFKNIIKKL